MYNGYQDVSRIVNGTSGINFALGISGIGHTNIKKLNFQQIYKTSIRNNINLIQNGYNMACQGMPRHAKACQGMASV